MRPINVKTQAYPGFPTDLQQPLTAMLTIAGGKTTADWPIGEEFTAEFELAIPQFLAEGAYTVQLENTVSIVSDYFINNKVGNIKVVQIERPLTTTSSVEVIDGKTQMIVNGEAVAPMWYARPERPAQLAWIWLYPTYL